MLKDISIEHVVIGMYLTELNADWIPDTNFKKSGLLKKQETIDKIKKLGVKNVIIDTDKGSDSPHASEQKLKESASELKALGKRSYKDTVKQHSFEKEKEQAVKLHSEAVNLVDNIMNNVKVGKAIEVKAVAETADGFLQSLFRNQNALACVTRIRDKDFYLLEHSVNVGVLMGILAKSMGFEGTELHQLVTGAILHDIGKIRVPDKVLNKPGRLEPEEWEEMKNHVQYGYEVLLTTPDVTEIALAVCNHHHERLDGNGYPNQLKDDQVSQWGRMAAVCDVYDAITADRVYHKGMPPTVALKKMLEWADDGHLDKKIVYAFIRTMSIYPIGTLVELSSGRAAIVIEPNSEVQDKPVVKVFYNLRHNHHIEVYQADLNRSAETDSIVKAIDPDDFGLDLKEVFQNNIM